ncbi:hypothetical protein PR202_ga14740 [Eleusine coracana subsp. coracana]|uniref:Uncharacterized protein n=1 Tax=Eleusine coracana subsp. coracana TaxID=191504 RepID=A0AAV5CIG1_ELECO|nr:hypothetical protein PR202_ga14740 [Eleusine coracana subsp. coracana]
MSVGRGDLELTSFVVELPASMAVSRLRNLLDHPTGKFTQVLYEDVVSDQTLPRTESVRRTACGHGKGDLLPGWQERRGPLAKQETQ